MTEDGLKCYLSSSQGCLCYIINFLSSFVFDIPRQVARTDLGNPRVWAWGLKTSCPKNTSERGRRKVKEGSYEGEYG
jgi:hypothetical protein